MKPNNPYLKIKLILLCIVFCNSKYMFSQHDHHNQHGHVHQSMRLAPNSTATHKAVQSGVWSDTSTWGGEIPSNDAKVIIPASITVTVDKVFNERLSTIRVDGTLLFSTKVNTQLNVETIVTMPHSSLIIGTENDPINEDVSAKILFIDTGDIDTNYDPQLLSRGIIALGKIVFYGAEKTSFVKANQWFPSGTSSFELETAPLNWSIGDRIVLSGILNKQQEEFTIKNIVGKTITLDHPTTNDRLVSSSNEVFNGLYPYVANYSRNIILESENKVDIHRRGHIMFMHQQEVDMKYVQLEELGRTNKAIELEKPVTAPTTNVVGRYALHFHRAGDMDKNGRSGYVKGCVVWGSPGWGFVNHESNVWFDDNASYNVLGSHFTDENGSELGGFRRNIAIYSKGSINNAGDWAEKRRENGDHGHSGVGFWATTGATVRWDGNIATDQNMSGFAIISRKAPDDLHEYDYNVHDDPSQGGGRKLVNAKHVGINFFKNNINYGGVHGLTIVDLELNGMFNTNNLFENFISLNTISRNGLMITYMRNLHLKNVKVLRDDVLKASKHKGAVGIYVNSTFDHLFRLSTKGWSIIENVTVYGFVNGFQIIRDKSGKLSEKNDNKLYIDNQSSFFLKGGQIADNMDINHFKDNVDINKIPNRPYFSVAPGIHNEEVQLKIISEPGTTVYYSYGVSGSSWRQDTSAIKGLDLKDANKYNGETITFNTKRSVIFAVAVKDGLQSRVRSGWYYVEEKTDEVVAVSGLQLKNDEAISLVVENKMPAPHYHIHPTNASDKSVVWSSSNEDIMKVDPNTGEITAIATGEATLVVRSLSNDKIFDTTKVIVSEENPDTDSTVAVTGVTVNVSEITLDLGEEITVVSEITPSNATNKTVVWTSSNEAVAYVNDLGKVVGLSEGNAILTVATDDGDFKRSITVVVKEDVPVGNVKINTYQAEDSDIQKSSRITSNVHHQGYTGTGYVDYGGDTSYIEWSNVEFLEENTTIMFTYANGSSSNRSCELFVDGKSYGVVGFTNSGGWSNWITTEGKNISIAKGIHRVRLVANTRSGGPNLDKMELVNEIKPLTQFSIKVFPNPTNTQQVTIETEEVGGIIRIFDNQGNLILNTTMVNSSETLDVSNLVKGIYIVEVENVFGVKNRKKLIVN